MANVPGALVGLLGGQVAGRVLGGFLASDAGEKFLLKLDRRPLTPLEHRVLAQKWSANIGKAVSGAFLSSGTGEKFLLNLDRRPLTPLEHRVLAQKWSANIGKAVSGAAAVLFLAQRNRPDRGVMGIAERSLMGGPTVRKTDWIQMTHRVAELLLAVGAVFKVVGEYLEDRQKVAEQSERAAAKRLI